MILKVESVYKTYQQGNKNIDVLKNLSFNLQKNESLAILGHSGSGKSTLLSLLSGLDYPDSGSITLDGMVLTDCSEAQLTRLRAKKIGIIFQNFHLLPHLTAKENICLPLEILKVPKAQGEALKWLERIDLEDRGDHFPDQLSGGEKQRVAVARALAINPDLLLADEPSGSLDEETGKKIMDLIFRFVKEDKKTLILVTHNKELAKNCQHQSLLLGGNLIAET